jgi:hypothetical protein
MGDQALMPFRVLPVGWANRRYPNAAIASFLKIARGLEPIADRLNCPRFL